MNFTKVLEIMIGRRCGALRGDAAAVSTGVLASHSAAFALERLQSEVKSAVGGPPGSAATGATGASGASGASGGVGGVARHRISDGPSGRTSKAA